MTKEQAIIIQKLALDAISSLSSILLNIKIEDTEEHERLKKSVGMSIIQIDELILLEIEKVFPEISHLRSNPD